MSVEVLYIQQLNCDSLCSERYRVFIKLRVESRCKISPVFRLMSFLHYLHRVTNSVSSLPIIFANMALLCYET